MTNDATHAVPCWGCAERSFASSPSYENPFQDAALRVTFTAPSGRARSIDGFWDGGDTWRVRFAPDEPGAWSFSTSCSDAGNSGLHGQSGTLEVGPPAGEGPFARHGPVGVAPSRRHLAHADGTPFLWLADTAWSGPMMATDEEWAHYLRERLRQGFTAVQWMASESLVSPAGNREGERMIQGHERIAVNAAFFQRLDRMHAAINAAGLLSAPVLLWAAEWSSEEINARNPGYTLPEDQAALLARYMVARWGGGQVVWILNGDGDYRGAKAARWQRIGRAVFGEGPRAPTMLHPNGMNIPIDEFVGEGWLDIITYQSGHGDDAATLRWLTSGPPSEVWRREPPRPLLNLEPPYEDHIAYQSKQRFDEHRVRRALYWSMLNAPTAGVTYGGHGVWGWDDGSGPPEAHPGTGTPKPWREALGLPGAEQIRHLAACFQGVAWWLLRPSPELLAEQPGDGAAERFIAAAITEPGDAAVIYTPVPQPIVLRDGRWQETRWLDPRSGRQLPAAPQGEGTASFVPPGDGDWVLLLRAAGGKEPVA
jgi:hypothetical protein